MPRFHFGLLLLALDNGGVRRRLPGPEARSLPVLPGAFRGGRGRGALAAVRRPPSALRALSAASALPVLLPVPARKKRAIAFALLSLIIAGFMRPVKPCGGGLFRLSPRRRGPFAPCKKCAALRARAQKKDALCGAS